ncbi:hypothetical protein EW026_g2982 [Hermanssonia centrifuga]|uniref:Uncharacterized protein n=1 Tax=Hermanssonia centrifuga TaxID=98765 RepID=A0A4S4KLI6_9APHY|nr:hypothetical protein EW026_g2982 [Hermanssonia centrifuga]
MSANPAVFMNEEPWEEDVFDEDADGDVDYTESSGEEYSEEETEDAPGPQTGKGKDRDVGEQEQEVDQDFDRLVREIRAGDASAGPLSKVWDFDMKDREAEFKDDLREASGIGRKRGRKPGRQRGIILSPQVRALIGEGNQAYVDNDIPSTIRIMQEVIRIEPRAGSAWSVLAQCYDDMGEREKALQLRIMAAHLNQDPDEWLRLAEQSSMNKRYIRSERGAGGYKGGRPQKFWDSCEDDREWDVPAVSNTSAISGGRTVGDGEVQPGMYPLDVNARHRLAIARIKMGDITEGKIHANIVLAQQISEYAALFSEIADAYFEREMYAEAGHIYEMLGADGGTSSLYVLLQAASCRRMIGDIKEAADVYEHVIEADPTHNDAKMKLAEIYEILNEPRRALDLVLQVIDSRRKLRTGGRQDQEGENMTPAPDASGTSLFEEKSRLGKEKMSRPGSKAGKLTLPQLRELEASKEKDAVLSYGRVKELWARMLAGDMQADREWMHESESLVESFRETRALFLTTRQAGFRGMFPRAKKRKQTEEATEDSMASRLQLELGRDTLTKKSKSDGVSQNMNSFRTISFDDWLRLMMQVRSYISHPRLQD